MLTPNKKAIIEFMLDSGALKFGDFTLKSGRKSPFFMNAGIFQNGEQLDQLGRFFADGIFKEFGSSIDVIFGPSYKGIPLATIATEGLYRYHQSLVKYCSDRKEVKDHGDAGKLLGADLKVGNKVVIVEDVVTSGGSLADARDVIMSQSDNGAKIVGAIVLLDREECGIDRTKTAIESLGLRLMFPIKALVSMSEVIEYAKEEPRIAKKAGLTPEIMAEIDAYYLQYGPLREEHYILPS